MGDEPQCCLFANSLARPRRRQRAHADAVRAARPRAISTRPVSVVDPATRTFDYKPKLTLDAALGTHILLSRTVGLDVELRDTLYSEQLENALVASGPADMPSDPTSPSNPDTWYGSNRLTNFIALQLGVCFFAGGR